MSSLTIDEELTVQAEPDKVFEFLITPDKVVTCLPGAGLDEVEDERNFRGHIKVKVGPVAIAYAGKATLTEVDREGRKVTMEGEGKEKGGGGVVKMTMNSVVEEAEGGAKVQVHADVQLAGKVVRFGRGMIQGVSAQVFKEFGERLRHNLEQSESVEAGQGESKALQSAGTSSPARQEDSLNIVAIFFKALWAGIKAFFARLTKGKSTKTP